MTRLVHLSGELVAEQDAKISIFDSAIMLADTVTESTRTFHHTPFKLDEHIERLYLSLKLTRIDPQMSPAEMEVLTAFLISLRPAGQLPAGAVEDTPVEGTTPQPVELTE